MVLPARECPYSWYIPVTTPTLTPAQIRGIVDAALRGPQALDELLSNAVFGGAHRKPMFERDWPQSARNAWHAATRQYIEAIRSRNEPTYERADERSFHRERNPPTLETSWCAVESFMVVPGDPASIPRANWSRIAALCSVSARAADYHFTAIGWRFTGKKRGRRIVEAPCRGCGKPQMFAALVAGQCHACIDRSELFPPTLQSRTVSPELK